MTVTGEAVAGTYESFTALYDPSVDNLTDLLFTALGNNDPAQRGAIAHRLLDDGADGAAQDTWNNTLNVLLGQRQHDPETCGRLCVRLVAAGSDVNHRTRRSEYPLEQVLEIRTDDDFQRKPFYDALFGSPDLDLSLPTSGKRAISLLDWLGFPPPTWDRYPLLQSYVDEYVKRV